MTDDADRVRAEIEALKNSLGTTAGARKARGKKVKATIETRVKTGRNAVFAVRVVPEAHETIRRICAARQLSVAEWFADVLESEARRAKL